MLNKGSIKAIGRAFFGILAAVTAVAALAGCGSAAAAPQLLSETKLPSSGIVTKDQLSTLQGKTGTYRFTGTDGAVRYTWAYNAAQIKNPADQHLKISVTTKGSDLKKVRDAASNAPYAISVKIPNFELAGSPQLSIELPQAWNANVVKLVARQAGSLRQITAAQPRIAITKKATLLIGTITLTNKTLYFVGGYNKNEPPAGESKGSKGKAENKNDTADSAGSSDGSATARGSGGSAANGEAGVPSGSSKSANPSRDPDSVQVTVSVDAKTAAARMGEVKQSKRGFVPSNGWIVAPTRITLRKGQTAYDALVQVTKSRGIQMDSSFFPAFNAYYVRGINNLYEFDGGQTSGWMYSVDGWFPNYGSSQYSSLESGSVIQWRYTMELGHDVSSGQ